MAREFDLSINEHGIEAIQEPKQHPRKRPGFESPTNFFVSFLSHLVIYIANVWNEKEADNARERRDFEDDEVKSHIRLSLLSPSITVLNTINNKNVKYKIYLKISICKFLM